MNKTIKRVLCFLIAFVLTLGSVKLDTNAAGGLSISASASQVNAGGTFTVTVRSSDPNEAYAIAKIAELITFISKELFKKKKDFFVS